MSDDDYREALQLEPAAADELSAHQLLSAAQLLTEQEDYDGAISKASQAMERAGISGGSSCP